MKTSLDGLGKAISLLEAEGCCNIKQACDAMPGYILHHPYHIGEVGNTGGFEYVECLSRRSQLRFLHYKLHLY